MKYILDSNVLIDAKRRLFPMDTYPKFWTWLVECAKEEIFFIPESVFDEIQTGTDALAEWVKEHKTSFFLPKLEAYQALPNVLEGYANIAGIPSEECLEALKADPFIIAHGIVRNCTVVTSENYFSRNATNINKIKIPAVCEQLGIRCIGISTFIWEVEKKHFD